MINRFFLLQHNLFAFFSLQNELFVSNVILFFVYVSIDGAYERSMSFCPPPLTMIIFSILEIIAFLVDIIYFQ